MYMYFANLLSKVHVHSDMYMYFANLLSKVHIHSDMYMYLCPSPYSFQI